MVDVPGAEVKADLEAAVKELQQTEAISDKMKVQLERVLDRIHFLRGQIAALQKYVKPAPQGDVPDGQPKG